MAEYTYRYNPETGRWDVIKRRPDGTVEVLHKMIFDTPDAAMNLVSLLTGKRRLRIPPGKWVSQEEGRRGLCAKRWQIPNAQNDGKFRSASKLGIQTGQAGAQPRASMPGSSGSQVSPMSRRAIGATMPHSSDVQLISFGGRV